MLVSSYLVWRHQLFPSHSFFHSYIYWILDVEDFEWTKQQNPYSHGERKTIFNKETNMSGYDEHSKEGQSKVKEAEVGGEAFLQRLGKASLKAWDLSRGLMEEGNESCGYLGEELSWQTNDKVRGVKVGSSLVYWRTARRPVQLTWNGQRGASQRKCGYRGGDGTFGRFWADGWHDLSYILKCSFWPSCVVKGGRLRVELNRRWL